MYRLMALTVSVDNLEKISFLKNNPTTCYQKGSYYKFYYFEPLDTFLTTFFTEGIKLDIETDKQVLEGWVLVRDFRTSIACPQLIQFLEQLELGCLKSRRQAIGMVLEGWLFNAISYGLSCKRDIAIFVRLMYLHGYNFDDVINIFSSIINNTDLNLYFLTVANHFYKGESLE